MNTVLIVDDEPANIDLIKGILPSTVKCKAAVSGQIALKLLTKQVPDLIFLDLIMPGMDGIETLSAIREQPELQNTPVIIVSGNKNDEQMAKLEAMGISGYVTKPIDSEMLLDSATPYLG